MRSLREHFIRVHRGGRTKEPILNETKPPIPKMRQNRRFCAREQMAMKIVSLIKASWSNYQYLAIILPITNKK